MKKSKACRVTFKFCMRRAYIHRKQGDTLAQVKAARSACFKALNYCKGR